MSFNSYKDYKIKEALKALQFLYGSAIFLVLLFGGVILKLVYESGNSSQNDYGKTLFLLVTLSITFLVLSLLAPNFIIKRITKTKTAEAILKTYKNAFYMKYTLILIPIFGSFIGFLYYSNYYFMLLSAILLMFLIAQMPTKKGINRVITA